jgi:ABC-type uncharacterized transport system fused permease/ATPase subunit
MTKKKSVKAGKSDDKVSGRKLALTILVGVFIAIMVITLFNLLVSYVYEPPAYEKYCNGTYGLYPVKADYNYQANCKFSQELQTEQEKCYGEMGQPVFSYDANGCAVSLKKCDLCPKEFEEAMKKYNRHTFFVFAAIGFILIVVGLFISNLLIQIITLPAGAVLVIESAVRNFDDKLYVIITFSLLIIAAVYLAIKKLR